MIIQLGAIADAILTVVVIIALMAVVGGVIYFLGDVLLSIIDGNKADNVEKPEPVKQLTQNQENTYLLNFEDTVVNNKTNNNSVDLQKAKQEQLLINNSQKNQLDEIMESRMSKLNEKKVSESEYASDNFFSTNTTPVSKINEEEDLEAQYQSILDEISNKVTSESKKESKPKEEDFDFDFDFDFDDEEESVKETKAEDKKPAEKIVEKIVTVEDTEKVKSLEEEIATLKDALEQERQAKQEALDLKEQEAIERARLQTAIEEERLAIEEERLAREQEQLSHKKSKADLEQFEIERQAWAEEKMMLEQQIAALKDIPEEVETLDSLQARLANLQERLKVAEKELKANKKEYLPLARIKKTLQNDEAKLRRKEAIVAKQKIVLFGVSNYVVDPEKEKKLAEDLDILEALRLSVQHCEDVMRENADRYPILENTNKILVKTVKDLKDDVAIVQRKIEALKANGGNQ